MTKYLFLFLLLLPGCGKVSNRPVEINSPYERYGDLFRKAADRASREYVQPGPVTVRLSPDGVPGGADARVYYQSGEFVIDQAWWESRGEESREAMFMHLFGHYILGRKHGWVVRDGTAESLMYYLFKSEDYAGRREYYLHELFDVREEDKMEEEYYWHECSM